MQPENRRIFLKNTSLALGLPLLAGSVYAKDGGNQRKQSKVVIIRDKNALRLDGNPNSTTIRRMIDRGIQRLANKSFPEDAWRSFFATDRLIAIKSNISVRPVHSSIHRAIVQSLSDSCKAQPEIRIWDRNRGGIELDHIKAGDWNWIPGYSDDCLSHAIHWADGLINTPVLKTHPITGLSGAVKNWAGAVTNINQRDDRVAFAIHAGEGTNLACIPALPQIRSKSRLIVMDALNPLYQTDNSSYSSWPYCGLILGTDPVAVDRIGWEIVKNHLRRPERQTNDIPREPKHLLAASSTYQLGNWNLEDIEIQLVGWKQDNYLA